MVSIVIPAYNASKQIVKALSSVYTQTYKDYEIIVIDDGSVDNTKEIVDKFISEKNINGKCIKQENKKIAGARNTGILHAKGTLIAFLDHDDVWHPEKLEKVVKIFSEDNKIDLVCHDEILKKENKIIQILKCGIPYGNLSANKLYEHMLFKKNVLSTSAVTVKKEVLDRYGIFDQDPRYNSVEDYDLWLRLSKHCNFYFLHEILGEYNLEFTNITNRVVYHHNNTVNVLMNHFRIYQIENKNILIKYKVRNRLSTVNRVAARALIKKGEDKQTAWLFTKQMMFYNPLHWKNIITFSYFAFKYLVAQNDK